jgi:formamidopyrimidine-DNA glycosylase
MPELPEVETIVLSLRPCAAGKTIVAARLNRTDVLIPADLDLSARLRNQTIATIDRRGKRIVFALTDGNRFFIHLGMTGRLTLHPPADPLLPHTHLVLTLGNIELRFRDPRRFGGIWWLGRNSTDDLGPEPLTLAAGQLKRRLAATRRAIKSALLDQQLIAGLGNIYVDEALHTAGIHPLTPADTLTDPQVRKLNQSIKKTLRKAIRHRGSTLRDYVDSAGGKGAFQNLHKVYAREGQPCRTCGKAQIQRIIVGGRSTHFCGKCQRKVGSRQ